MVGLPGTGMMQNGDADDALESDPAVLDQTRRFICLPEHESENRFARFGTLL
jgi:hypothetical protein